jgi:TatD DNase family protein
MLIDTHAHLNHDDYSKDVREVLDRARAAGVSQVIVPGYDRSSSEKAVELARVFGIAASVGIHPHDAADLRDEDLAWFREQAEQKKIVAIGEIGLDYYRDLSPRDMQQQAFRAQIALAKDVALPIIVHNRDAGADTLRILKHERAAEVGGVLHCFSENLDYAMQTVEMGFHIGIAGPVTYKSSTALQEVAVKTPLDRILVETDAPYLSPQKFRGRRNQPAYVGLVAEMIADLRGMTLEELAAATTKNARRLFGLAVSNNNT